MSDLVSCTRDELPGGEPCFRIHLHAPRANALEPGLLSALHAAFDALDAAGTRKALITSTRNFSSGGDVARFLKAAEAGQADSFAKQVVPPLQALILRMIKMPVVVATALRGAATGGSAGIVFASDIAVAAPDAFVQPYYGPMGFAPDGGWLALLPELLGGASARSWIMANQRKAAGALLRLGLVQAVDATPEDKAMELLGAVDTGTACASKALFWDAARRSSVAARLDAETDAFLSLIQRPETQARMHAFLKAAGGE